MSESSEQSYAVLNLSPEERRASTFLFDKADTDQLGVLTGERAVSFFERTGVPSEILGEIWGIADQENRGLLTKPGFSIALRLIGHYQAGKRPSPELAFVQGPVPKFEGVQLPIQTPTSPSRATFPATALQPQNSGQGIRIPPLDPQKVAQYTGLFERSGAQNGLLDGQTAKTIFEKAGLPVETLGKIWTLADREQRGALDQTEFIVAMHLLTSMKSRSMTALPSTLPTGFYDAAARRGAPPPPQARQPGQAPRQFSGGTIGAPVRTSSPLARGPYTPTAAPWLVAPAEKAKYDQFFATIDTQARGVITGEQAVGFFGDSGLPEDTLASIWDLADINNEGQLNKDEFAVAMYLIRQQRASNATPLPAFLPPQLIPPSMRKQQQAVPAFEAPSKPAPKSAADDLFGLDEPVQAPIQQPLAPTATGGSVSRDPFGSAAAVPPASPARNQIQPPAATSTFKPFVPSSAFGASLTQQSTGGSHASAAPAQPQVSATDDLLGDNETGVNERSKLDNDTTELANMSNQIGNLRSQMEQTQAKKATAQNDLGATNAQKRDLETRLQQFRAQYEQEVRAVKELEQQLTTSRDSTKKLGQELALLEGTHTDLQTQHQTIAQSLQADQAENNNLKQRIAQINTEVNRLKPEIEKLKLDARQHKGMVSINKKQLATNETERDRLQGEKEHLEHEAAEAEKMIQSSSAAREVSSTIPPAARDVGSTMPPAARDVGNTMPPAAKDVVSPSGSTMSANNPFFRKTTTDTSTDREASSSAVRSPNPTAFDQLFGPSFAGENKSPAPPTSFGNVATGAALGTVAGGIVGAGLHESMSSDGKATPIATPPLSEDSKEVPATAEPPPPPEAGQFKPVHLPVGGLKAPADEDAMSTSVAPPASRAGFVDTPGTSSAGAITPVAETLPGTFPLDPESAQPSQTKSEFDSAFANLDSHGSSKETHNDNPFGASIPAPPVSESNGTSREFPPIQTLGLDGDDSDSSEDDHHSEVAGSAVEATAIEPSTSSQPVTTDLPPITAQTSPPTYEQSEQKEIERTGSNDFPKEFTGLLPARENVDSIDSAFGNSPEANTPRAVPVKQLSFPEPTPSNAVDEFHDASSRPLSSVTDDGLAGSSGQRSLNEVAHAAPTNAFDEFDEFEDLAEAKEVEKESNFDFGFGSHSRGDSEFNAAFDSSTTSRAPTGSSQTGTNGFTPSASASSPFTTGGTSNSSLQNTPQGQHDWDAIFSGLDSSKNGDVDTSFGNDLWVSTNGEAVTAAPATLGKKAADSGRAVTPGTEHDDPILKRLTGMGYPRADALNALEMYDYDIGKAVDHLSSK